MNPSIIFVVTGYYCNGGTTFLIRLLNELKKNKVRVGVLFLKHEGEDSLLDEILDIAEVRFLSTSKLGIKLFPLTSILASPQGIEKWFQSFNHVHVMGFFSYIKSIYFTKEQSLSVGVYQQDEYISAAFRHRYVQKFVHNVFKTKNQLFVFFNENNLAKYSEKFNITEDCITLTPIGVPEVKNISLKEKNNTLISVGNLMEFKTYFKNTIDVIADLKSRGFLIHYEIYGEGPNKEWLKKYSIEMNVSEQVHFKGTIPYSELYIKLKAAKALIGSGTVVLEASMLGTPSIIGIENESKAVTYGFLSDFDGLSYNEKGIDLPLYPLKDKIYSVMNMDVGQRSYSNLQELSRTRARDFSIKKTSQDFTKLALIKKNIYIPPICLYKHIRVILSVFYLCIGALKSQNKSFVNRKKQQ